MLPVFMYPDIAGVGFPTKVTVNIYYYQQTTEIKLMALMAIYLTDYVEYK